jgi:ABC-type lipoprotein release transport system permease subunit
MLFAAVLVLLLIGCANVSILMLARGTARQHEFAVRASVGATRTRIVRQLLTEAVILSLVGAGAGVLIAYKCVDLLAANLPQNSFPHEAAIHVTGTVLLFDHPEVARVFKESDSGSDEEKISSADFF